MTWEFSGVVRDLVSLMLLSVAGVTAMLAWFVSANESPFILRWPPPKATIGLRLAAFFAADAVVYTILGLAILDGEDHISAVEVSIVTFVFWATIALFSDWAREGEE